MDVPWYLGRISGLCRETNWVRLDFAVCNPGSKLFVSLTVKWKNSKFVEGFEDKCYKLVGC
jgi:hypothetical protein